MNYFVGFSAIVISALRCVSANENTRQDIKSLNENIVGLNYTIYNLVAALKSHEDVMVKLSHSAKLPTDQELERVTVGTSTEKSTTLAEDLMANSSPLIKLQRVEELENETVRVPTMELTTLVDNLLANSSPLIELQRVQDFENVTVGTSTSELTTLADDLLMNSSPLVKLQELEGLENVTVRDLNTTEESTFLAADLIGILGRNETNCVEFIELDRTAAIARTFKDKIHPVSCMWIVWAKQGGPITIQSLPESKPAEDRQLHSNLSVFVLNHNLLVGGYNVTKLDLGVKMNFSTDYLKAEGFYPFVIIHVIALPTGSDQRVHLKLWDQSGGFKFELSKKVHKTNPLKTWKEFVDFPRPQNYVLLTHDRRFLLGQASHDKSVRLTIGRKGRLPMIDFVEIQVSWLNITSRSIEQRSYNNGMRKDKIEIYLEPSTPFAITFSSLQEGHVESSFRVGYKYY